MCLMKMNRFEMCFERSINRNFSVIGYRNKKVARMLLGFSFEPQTENNTNIPSKGK